MNPHSFFGGVYNKPFKIFVTAREKGEKSEAGSSGTSRHEINIPDSKAVYEEVISSAPKSRPKAQSPKELKKVQEPLQKFNKSQFLKSCQENDFQGLSQMDLTEDDNLNVVDSFGWNGLMIAACSNAVDAFSFLLSRNINYELSDKSGRSALDLAEKKGHLQIIEAFRSFVNQQRLGGTHNLEESAKERAPNAFHCEICDMNFTETTRESHSTSVLHQFNTTQPSGSTNRMNYGIPVRNPGYQLMLKQGWNTRGLGPDETGRLYPVKTTLRKPRSGLGTEQSEPGRVTHFQPNDRDAVRYRPPERAKGRREMSRDYETERRKERRLRKALS